MSDSNKSPNTPKLKFSPYWIYGAIIIAIIAFNFLNSGGMASKKISKNEFFEILKDNDIKEIAVINKNIAEIYIKKDAIKKQRHEKFVKSAFYRPGAPLYEYNFGDLKYFEETVDKAKKDYELDLDFDNEDRQSIWEGIFGLLPFILLIAIWLFFMRRMSGAGGAGGGGQIFSIGKSKAKLFDENTKVKTTFENVAGLEGAKEEVQKL